MSHRTTRAKISVSAGLAVLGVAGTLLFWARALHGIAPITVTSIRYVGRTAVVRLTNEGDSFVRCSRLVPAADQTDPGPWLWPVNDVDLMPHSSFEFGVALPPSGSATIRVRCEHALTGLRQRVARWLSPAAIHVPGERFVVRVELPPGTVPPGPLAREQNTP